MHTLLLKPIMMIYMCEYGHDMNQLATNPTMSYPSIDHTYCPSGIHIDCICSHHMDLLVEMYTHCDAPRNGAKVWYPYILGLFGVHYRKVFGTIEGST
jgi:hypothetical protein